MNPLRWKIEKLDGDTDAITILEMPEEWRKQGCLGMFAGIKVWSFEYPEWAGTLFLPGMNRKCDLAPIRVPHAETPRVVAALRALAAWSRGEKVEAEVEYGTFEEKCG